MFPDRCSPGAEWGSVGHLAALFDRDGKVEQGRVETEREHAHHERPLGDRGAGEEPGGAAGEGGSGGEEQEHVDRDEHRVEPVPELPQARVLDEGGAEKPRRLGTGASVRNSRSASNERTTNSRIVANSPMASEPNRTAIMTHHA